MTELEAKVSIRELLDRCYDGVNQRTQKFGVVLGQKTLSGNTPLRYKK